MNGFMVWMRDDLFHWLVFVVAWCLLIGLPVLLIMSFFPRFRKLVGVILFNMSYLTGFACWVFSLIVTYGTLGGVWLVVGLLFVGGGVFPLALIGTVVTRTWSTLPDLIFAIVLMIVPRSLGLWLLHREENRL